MKDYKKDFKYLGIKYSDDYYDADEFGKKLKEEFPKQKDVTYSSGIETKNKNVSTNLVNFK